MNIKNTIISALLVCNTVYSSDDSRSLTPVVFFNGYKLDGDYSTIPVSGKTAKQIEDLEMQIEQQQQTIQRLNEQLLEKDRDLNNTIALVDDQKQAIIVMQQQSDQDKKLIEIQEQLIEQLRDQLYVPLLNGWRYSDSIGWLYTDSSTFPFVYLDTTQTWYHFVRDRTTLDQLSTTTIDRAFYNYTTNEWEIWE